MKDNCVNYLDIRGVSTLLISLNFIKPLPVSLVNNLRVQLLTNTDQHSHNLLVNLSKTLIDSSLYDPKTLNNASQKAYQLLDQLSENGIQVISISDPSYPARFKDSSNPPLFITARGNITALNAPHTAALIGSRKIEDEIFKTGLIVSSGLASEGWVIVSGLAKGSDTAAHLGCLQADGITTAVLPSSLLNIYPPENRELAEDIVANQGCLISTNLPHQKIQKYSFIDRNQLIAAISDKIFVLANNQDGGTSSTIKFASKSEKEIIFIDERLHSHINEQIDLQPVNVDNSGHLKNELS